MGFALGLAMGLSRRIRGALDPLVAAIHPVPKIAVLPLFLVVFGSGETATIFVIALAALFTAMRRGATLSVHGPVSRSLLSNLVLFQKIWAGWFPGTYCSVDLEAEAESDVGPGEGEAILAFSGGSTLFLGPPQRPRPGRPGQGHRRTHRSRLRRPDRRAGAVPRGPRQGRPAARQAR